MRFLVLISLLVLVHSSFSQNILRLSPKESQLIIRGTSTLHNWQCKVEQPIGQLVVELENGNIKDIKSMALAALVMSIKSIDEKGAYYEKSMDKNVYRAMQAEKFPTVTFTLSKINKRSVNAKGVVLDGVCIARIAGVSKEINFLVQSNSIAGGVMVEGKLPLKMTDFKIEPPTAIFGTIKTGNDILLEFKMACLLQPGK